MMAASSRTNLLLSYKFQIFFHIFLHCCLKAIRDEVKRGETLAFHVSSLQNEFGVFWQHKRIEEGQISHSKWCGALFTLTLSLLSASFVAGKE